MTNNDLNALLVRYRDERDPQAIADLFEATAPRLWRLAMQLSKHAADADDLLQSTYVTALEKVAQYDEQRPALPWLMGILTNRARVLRRSQAQIPDPERLVESEVIEPSAAMDAAEAKSFLTRAVAVLPEMQQSVIELVLGEELSPSEIAARLGRTPGAVRVQLHRGVNRLRELLPPSLALPAALVSVRSGGLEALQARVVAEANSSSRRLAAAGVTGGTGLAKVAAALALAGFAAFLGVRSLPPQTKAKTTRAISPGIETSNDELDRTGSLVAAKALARKEERRFNIAAPLPAGATQIETPRELSPIFELGVTRGQGIDLDEPRVTDSRDGDAYTDQNVNILRAGPGSSIAWLQFEERSDNGVPFSADAYLRSVRGIDPGQLQWNNFISFGSRDPHQCVFVIRRLDHSHAVLCIANVSNTSNWYEERAAFRGRLLSDAPSSHAIAIDESAFDSDPYRSEQRARRSAFLRKLDERVESYRSKLHDPKMRLAGLAQRHVAGQLSTDFGYYASTYSFPFATRDDVHSTRNNWSFAISGRGIDVALVTNDRSRAWNLGAIELDALPPGGELDDGVELLSDIAPSDLLLVHTVDDDTDRWDVLRVLDVDELKGLVFGWKPFEDASYLEAWARATASNAPLTNTFEVEMRVGHGGSNPRRAFLDGTATRIDSVSALPLDLTTPPNSNDDDQAFVRGGFPGPGQAWELSSIEVEYWASERAIEARSDSVARSGATKAELQDQCDEGCLRIFAGEKPLLLVPATLPYQAETWTGRRMLSALELATTAVEMSEPGVCRVVFHGRPVETPNAAR